MTNVSPWASGGLPQLNVAATCSATSALGPGVRAVVWVQGCPLNCPECVAPDWIPFLPARLVAPEELAQELLERPDVTGLTLSGGEPMLQAAGLAALAQAMAARRDLTVICFTGFLLEHLRRSPPGPGVEDLLRRVDVLIDGPYVAPRNDQQGLRGSANQRVHYLSGRLKGDDFDFDAGPRRTEIHLIGREALLVGVPPTRALRAFHAALDRAEKRNKGGSE